MGHYLLKSAFPRSPKLPISETEYVNILASWSSLSTIAAIEEEWDCLIQNYIELETELIRSAMNSMVLNHADYHEMNQTRLAFSRRLSNLLHSCKSYSDHIKHHLNRLATPELKNKFEKSTSAAYDSSSSYRFMEALRNYAQHRAMPLHGVTLDAAWTGNFDGKDKSEGLHRHSLHLQIDLRRIRSDQKFKAAVRAEIANSPDHLDVSILVREYIERLAQVHEDLRTSIKSELDQAIHSIQTAIKKFDEISQFDTFTLKVVEWDDEKETAINSQTIFGDLLQRIYRLTHQNRNLVNLRLRYVSSEVTPLQKEKRIT